jgi:hypothetical protein
MSLISSEFSISESDISNNPLDQLSKGLLVPFWSENPNVLLDSRYITEFFPVEGMTYNQKLNAITRAIIVLTIILYLYDRSTRVVLIGIITLGSIYLLHHYRQKEKKKKAEIKDKQEGFDNPALAVLKGYSTDASKTFDTPTDTNPFSNVLLPDYDYNPEKKPAPPAFNANQTILQQAQQLVIDQNPGQPDIAKKLFTDLGEQFVFEQSLQPFYSNPSTTIPNDQAGFADFCYGSMVSCKEGNLFSCARNLDRYTN